MINDKKNHGIGWLREAGRRIKSHPLLKALAIPGFMAIFFVAYFLLLKYPLFPVTVMPITTLDRWIAFQPWALPLYASLWIYVCLPPALLNDKRQLLSYLWAAIGLSLAAMLVFFFWPTATPQPDINWALYPSFSFLKSVDTVRNAFPSLHVAFAVFSFFWLARLLRQMGAGAIVHVLNVFWCLAILYSTLATRQHVAIDLYAGAVLGGAAFALHMRVLPRSAVLRAQGSPQPDAERRLPGE